MARRIPRKPGIPHLSYAQVSDATQIRTLMRDVPASDSLLEDFTLERTGG